MSVFIFIIVVVLGAALGLPGFIVLPLGIFFAAAVLVLASKDDQSAKLAEEARASGRKKFNAVMEEHLHTLAARRLVLVKKDRYGVVDMGGWMKEVKYFMENVLLPSMTPEEMTACDWAAEVDSLAKSEQARMAVNSGYDDSISPIEYEHFCARLLRDNGWVAETTKASGDQGADIVAKRGTEIVVVQCKKFAGPVGNFAVQEVAAARRHYGAHLAVVVAPNGFTSSARELAATNDVTLLHHAELPTFRSGQGRPSIISEHQPNGNHLAKSGVDSRLQDLEDRIRRMARPGGAVPRA
jgi:restriction system protein